MTECSAKPAEYVILLSTLQLNPAAFRVVSVFFFFVLSCAFVFTVGKNDGSVNGKKYFSWWVLPNFLAIFLVLLGFYRFKTS